MTNPTHPRKIKIDAEFAETLSDEALLQSHKLALICSRKCPGDVILKTYDFARLVRGSGLAIVSGFHSPIEKDCLPILLRGKDRIIIVQAHRLSTTRLPRVWQEALKANRMLILSPFVPVAAVSDRRHRSEIDATTRSEVDATMRPNPAKRVTAKLAEARNRFVAAISDEVLIPYAAPGGKTEALALEVLKSGKAVYTFNHRPGPLLEAGARLVAPDFFVGHSQAPPDENGQEKLVQE